MDDKELTKTRLKLYFAPLLPIDKKLIKPLDLSRLNVNKIQAYVYNKDVYRELFCQILLDIGKQINDRPSYKVCNLSELIDHHFEAEKSSKAPYTQPSVLFIIYTISGLENSYTGPIINKVLEERKALGKRTFIFYRGNSRNFINLRISSVEEIVDFNTQGPNTDRRETIL